MPIYEVTAVRRATFYVEADSEEQIEDSVINQYKLETASSVDLEAWCFEYIMQRSTISPEREINKIVNNGTVLDKIDFK